MITVEQGCPASLTLDMCTNPGYYYNESSGVLLLVLWDPLDGTARIWYPKSGPPWIIGNTAQAGGTWTRLTDRDRITIVPQG